MRQKITLKKPTFRRYRQREAFMKEIENEGPERSKGNWMRVKSKKPAMKGISQRRKWLSKPKA